VAHATVPTELCTEEDALDQGEDAIIFALSHIPTLKGGNMRAYPAAAALADYLSREVGMSRARAEDLVERISTMSFTEYGQVRRASDGGAPRAVALAPCTDVRGRR
jgi:hypothetical protein